MENKVELLGYYGGDKRVCLSAWQSTTSELGLDIDEIPLNETVDVIFKHLAKQKKKSPFELIEMLARLGHHSPFEKIFLDFQICGDIASHIHALKHRISQINSESARYRELTDKFYLPEDWLGIPMQNKELMNKYGCDTWYRLLAIVSENNTEIYHEAIKELTPKLGRARAKESARYFLQYNKQLNFDWQMNFRSFVNIQNLRNKPDAQKEIRDIANDMLRLVENIDGNPFEYCLKAFDLSSK